MGKRTTKTPWEHFMTAVGANERILRKEKRKNKVPTLRQQLGQLEKSLKKLPADIVPVEEKPTFSYAGDVISEENWKKR